MRTFVRAAGRQLACFVRPHTLSRFAKPDHWNVERAYGLDFLGYRRCQRASYRRRALLPGVILGSAETGQSLAWATRHGRLCPGDQFALPASVRRMRACRVKVAWF